eukprot:g58017.t1
MLQSSKMSMPALLSLIAFFCFSGGCINAPWDWVDARGYGEGWEQSWGSFADCSRNGIDATQACCACGGGLTASISHSPSRSPTASISHSPSRSPTALTCADFECVAALSACAVLATVPTFKTIVPVPYRTFVSVSAATATAP